MDWLFTFVSQRLPAKESLSRSRVLILLLLFAAAPALVAWAQDPLTGKPFKQWSKGEAEKVLNDSAWAAHQEVRIQFDKEVQKAAGSYSGVSAATASQSQTEVSHDVAVDFTFTMRLRSALPVRQAIVRLRQLQTDIEKMSARELAAFDAQTKGLLECPACSANYVVTLSSKSKNSPGADAVYSTFKGGRLADLQRYVYLANEKGERRGLVHFVPPKVPGDEATFFFPRLNDKGEPLLTPENKTLFVNVTDMQANSVSNFRFDVAKLLSNGNVEF
jgi:hypothetical protein